MLISRVIVMKDSISILSNIVLTQDSLIATQDSTISLYKENEEKYIKMLGNKDMIVGLKDKQIKKEKTKALAGWALAVINGILLVTKSL